MAAEFLRVCFAGLNEAGCFFFDLTDMVFAAIREMPVILPHAFQKAAIAGFNTSAKFFYVCLAGSFPG
jgi:hypothetical protein